MGQQILMMGLNHTTAPLQLREQMARVCSDDQSLSELRSLRDPVLFPESVVLSTCNRTEIYVLTPHPARAEPALRGLFTGHGTIPASNDSLYTHADRAAVAHLFAVSSGIDSMLVGEFEILGQVRRAYLAADARHSVGPILHHLFDDAIHMGKRARSETGIGEGAASVPYAAVALAREQLGQLAGLRALVVGAGQMARRVANDLAADGKCAVVVANRTWSTARAVAEQIGGQAIPLDELAQGLAQADLVVSATSAPHVILNAAAIKAAMRGRAARPLCLIDIAVPRDVDPRAATLRNVRLYNIDDLKRLVDANRAQREKAVGQVQAIIAEQADKFWIWYSERRAAPVICELRGQAESIRQAELDRALRRLEHLHLADRDRQVIAALSAGIVSKILAAPTITLKERMQSGDGQVYLDTLSELFGLPTPETHKVRPA